MCVCVAVLELRGGERCRCSEALLQGIDVDRLERDPPRRAVRHWWAAHCSETPVTRHALDGAFIASEDACHVGDCGE